MSENENKPENQTVRVQGIASEEATGSPSDRQRTEAERVFDEQIKPLTDQVYDLCIQHKIPYVSSFDLGEGMTAASACHWYEAPKQSSTHLVGAVLQSIRMQEEIEIEHDESEGSQDG